MKTQKSIARLTAIILIVLFGAQATYAQYSHNKFRDHKEKIKTHKIAFITDILNLTPAEAEKFWPVYNENEDRMEKMHKEFGEKYHEMAENRPELSDDEANEFVNARLQQEQKMFDLKKQFHTELKGVISSKKILLLMGIIFQSNLGVFTRQLCIFFG